MPYMKDTAPAFGKQIKGNTVNMQFAVLSALGMFFVVDGHLNNSYLDIGGLFPYYSFHMPLFAFISGYFFRPGSEDDLGAYAKKKAVRLLGPYMAYNLIYGIITQFLHGAGFAFGGSLNLHNLLIEPFITGHQFEYNLAAWFVPALFLVEMANVLLRRVLGKAADNEYAVTAVYMGIGIGGISLSLSGRFEQGWLTLVRMMFLLPCYQWGTLYRQKLEEKDRISGIWYYGGLLTVQLGLAVWGRPLIYSVAFCNGFTGYILPYITAATGIAFWLRVSRTAASAWKDSPAVRYFGSHTYAVMMHHIMALMVLKTVFAALAKYTSMFTGFSDRRNYLKMNAIEFLSKMMFIKIIKPNSIIDSPQSLPRTTTQNNIEYPA
eukprot:MONOS_7241.1-p1 / transcript=MONOS_7241.1 / gene=MONOS_7241 / organism=Monocercomonoides_exilis_PA203 / gene_product=putative uncharacterized protein / transcript_product=putative uncharacterized protein / location=Mono_scaffold00243:255-1747(+) / protein_length=376 / sequence_SO=supercontig / SO=protein_coding / is_pseudo=false